MLNRTILRGIPAGVCCAVLAILVGSTPFGHALDDWAVDASFIIRGSRKTTARVVMISIDDASLDELEKPAAYLSPELGRVIRYVSSQGATAVGLDYFIPASLSNRRAIAEPRTTDPESEQGDGTMVAAAAIETQRVVLPAFLDADSLMLRRPLAQWELAAVQDSPTPYGLLNLTTDTDLFIRRQMLAFEPAVGKPAGEGKGLPKFFALVLYARSQGTTARRNGLFVKLADRKIPVDEQGRLRINFVGPAGTPAFGRLTLREVLAAEREHRKLPQLEGAIVILGVSGAGQQDIHPTPYSNGAARLMTNSTVVLMPGPEIHANTIATIHDQAYLTRPWWLQSWPWSLLAGAVLGAVFARVSLARGALTLAVSLTVVFAATYLLFLIPGWLLAPLPLVLTALSAYAAVLSRRWSQLRRIFAVVKSEAVTRALEADPRRLDPGGETRVITALFADIRGFTTFSERCGGDPKKVVSLLNAYYSVVIPPLEAEGGTIVAFMGDGLMVLFGAPVSQADHAARAVRAALGMTQAVARHRSVWAQHNFPDLRIGVGVHSGPAVVGAIGSGDRKDYTAIGDTINTASRVEGETKQYPAGMLITATTRRLIETDPLLLARCEAVVEPVQLKGRAEPVQLFQLT